MSSLERTNKKKACLSEPSMRLFLVNSFHQSIGRLFVPPKYIFKLARLNGSFFLNQSVDPNRDHSRDSIAVCM